MLAKPVIYDGALQRVFQQGDVVASAEIIATLTTVGAGTLTGAKLVNSLLNRSGPVAAYTDTTDTAANIIAAAGSPAGVGVQPGTSWRIKIRNLVAFAGTLAAGSGVTLAGITVIPPLTVLELLVQITNGTPTSVAAATIDGTTAVITGMTAAQTQLVTAGMNVSGTGIPASSTVLSVQPGVGVTISAATTVAGTLVSVTFTPAVTITGVGIEGTGGQADYQTVTSAATNTTLAAGDMEGAKTSILVLTANGANAITTRTADQLIAQIPNAQIGFKWILRVNNQGNNTVTFTGGTGVTISGTATVATTVIREYLLQYTAASTITMTNIGALAA